MKAVLERRDNATPEERAARGAAAQAELPSPTHATWEPPVGRCDPVDVLQAQAAIRVPELVPIRYGRMLSSPFEFYRGAAAVMAADLATIPTSGLQVQACGDAHLLNFGWYASPERELVFDVNDFDETLPGPWEWDLKRLAASLAVAGRQQGFKAKERRSIVMSTVAQYRKAISEFAAMGDLEVWYARLDTTTIAKNWHKVATREQEKYFQKKTAKARKKTSMRALAKLTHLVEGEPRIVSDPPLVVPIEELLPVGERDKFDAGLQAALRSYSRSLPADRRQLLDGFRWTHVARKVVGVGSVGTRCWIALLLGRDQNDPLFLQLKEAQPSVLEPFAGKSAYGNHGQRVVEGQRLMQAASDIFLGWTRIQGIDGVTRDFYVRQLWDWKESAPVEFMLPSGMTIYGQLCGWTLARAHACSGDRIAIAAYLDDGGDFEAAIAEFAERYAVQNERDYQCLVDAVEAGRVNAQTGL